MGHKYVEEYTNMWSWNKDRYGHGDLSLPGIMA